MIADLDSLVYLEYRQIANRIRETLRQPARAIMYLFAVAYFAVVAIMRHNGHKVLTLTTVPEPYASALFFVYVTLVGVMMYGAASGIVGAFSSAADARFLSGSLLSQRLVIMWLQLRRSGTSIARMIFTLLLYALIFSGSGTFAGLGLATIGGTLIATASAIPMLKLRRVIGTRTAQSAAGAVAAIGILPMVILLASFPPNADALAWAQQIERFGPGYAVNALIDGRAVALAALFAFGALAVGLSYLLGDGLFPDLYASSMRVLAFRERHSRGSATFAIQHRYEHRQVKAPHRIFDVLRGPWTIVWKEWIAFVRSPSMQRMFMFGLVMCAAAGGLFGHIAAGSRNEMVETVGFASMAAQLILIFVAMGSAIGLSADISKPLWWMGGERLGVRLFAWTIATSWRLAACLAAGIGAWAASLHAPIVALAGIPIALAVVLYLRAVGLALYSLFPSTIDQRGPLAMVRALLTYLLAAPPAVVSAVTGYELFHTGMALPHAVYGAMAAGIVCSLIETSALVAFASARIAGQGVAFARAESM